MKSVTNPRYKASGALNHLIKFIELILLHLVEVNYTVMGLELAVRNSAIFVVDRNRVAVF